MNKRVTNEPEYWYRIMGENLPWGCMAAWPDSVKAARPAPNKGATDFGEITDKVGEHGRVS